MDVLKMVVQIIYILICIALTVIVLMQEGKSAGLSGALTGSTDTFWGKNKGRSAEGALDRATKILAILFILISLALNLKW